jgi:hypothetical protein
MKVRMSPNSKFADISSIQKTQIKASETEIEQEEEVENLPFTNALNRTAPP